MINLPEDAMALFQNQLMRGISKDQSAYVAYLIDKALTHQESEREIGTHGLNQLHSILRNP